MSRSKRKTPIFGCTKSGTNKYAKQIGNRRYRTAVKQAIRNEKETLPELDEIFNAWDTPADGKHYWTEATAKAMRK